MWVGTEAGAGTRLLFAFGSVGQGFRLVWHLRARFVGLTRFGLGSFCLGLFEISAGLTDNCLLFSLRVLLPASRRAAGSALAPHS